MIDAFGFRTTAITRPIILSNLVDIVRESVHLISDKDTLKEMLVFCKNERGRAEALAGEHDDCVMALAIAYGCRDQQSFKIESEEEKEADPVDGGYVRRLCRRFRRAKEAVD